MTEYAVRFSKRQRLEHAIVMTTFVLLALTGFPQKFFETGWAHGVVRALGGLDHVRFIHRVSGLLFSILTLWHLGAAMILAAERKMKLTLLPNRQDFLDAVQQLRYDLGLAESQPRFDRFDYRQKFEYWGLIFGALIMVLSGFILYFPIVVSRVLPAELIPAAKVMHSYEAMLAFLIVLIWHMAGAHLTPESFPMDTSIFTGRIRKEKLRREHALEYEERFGGP